MSNLLDRAWNNQTLRKIQALWRKIDHDNLLGTSLKETNRKISDLAQALEAEDPEIFKFYESLKKQRLNDKKEGTAANIPSSYAKSPDGTRSLACLVADNRLIPKMPGEWAKRRKKLASLRGWCIQSRLDAIQDLTETHCAVLVELLRRCCKGRLTSHYVAHSILANAVGCSVSSVKAAIRLFRERKLFVVRATRLAANKNAPNLYRPCRALMNSLAPLVAPGYQKSGINEPARIRGQNSNPIYINNKSNKIPTSRRESPTHEIIHRGKPDGRKINGGWEPGAILQWSLPQLQTARSAIRLIEEKDPGPVSATFVEARIRAISQKLLPGIRENDINRAIRYRGALAYIALLATAFKATIRSNEPIRKPKGYFLGTLFPRKGPPDPLTSLKKCLEAHDACAAPIDLLDQAGVS